MNRSILIVICDFLLVSLLAFSTVDLDRAADAGRERQPDVNLATNRVERRQDLAATMRLALDDERRGRERLLAELTQTREALGQQQAVSNERTKQLQSEAQRALRLEQERAGFAHQAAVAQTNILTLNQQLQARSTEAQRLEQQRVGLEQQLATARTNLQALNQQLQTRATEAQTSKERLATLEALARQRQEQASALQQQLAQQELTNRLSQAEKQQLETRLQVAEAERRGAAEQLARAQDEVKATREEKARLTQHAEQLAANVQALASRSGELAQELRENRALAANTIFEDFATNRVQASFHAQRPGWLGLDANRRKEGATVLVTDGTNTVAVCHVDDTAVTLWNPGTDWPSLLATLNRQRKLVSVSNLVFSAADPRVVFLPVDPAHVRELGGKAYRLSPVPFKFPEAVLVGAREDYYGECKFQIDLATPQYVRMDRNVVKGLFGKFNPSRGDLVFSKTGDLLGIMANNTYCVLLTNLSPAATLRLGSDVSAQRSGDVLARLYTRVTQLPLKLQ